MLFPMTKSQRRAFSVLGAVCAVALGQTARAQEPVAVNVAVDATATGLPLKKVWTYHGFDEVNYSTSASGQALLRTLGSINTVPPHIRSHFLLNSGDGVPSLKWGSTNVYSEDTSGNPVYSWALMDGIMDAVTSAGTLPLVEIGFMPRDLAAPPVDPYQNTAPYALNGHCFNPPKDFAKWGELIRTWAAHVRDRYPNVESSWEWELWNEPDYPYWKGTPEQFLTLYDYTEAAIHDVLPEAMLGGPAVADASSTIFPLFLEHCATGTNAVTGTSGTRLDMVSFHAKGGVTVVDNHVQMNLGNQLRLLRVGFNAVSAIAKFKQTPINVTEADPDGCAACALANNPALAYRNSPAYGAYVVAMMKRTLELEALMGVNVRGLLTWAFLFEGMPYFAGYRTLVTNGIHLPVLNAFKLLGKLDGMRLPLTSSGSLPLDAIITDGVRGAADVDGMATRNGQQVTVMVWNYHDDLVNVSATPIHLKVDVPAGFGARAAMTHLRVDEAHGDAYSVWLSQGSPATPSAEQISALEQAMEPSSIEPAGTVDVTNGSVNVDFALPRFGISLITLTPAPDAPPNGSAASAAGGGCACRLGHSKTSYAAYASVSVALGLTSLLRRRQHRQS